MAAAAPWMEKRPRRSGRARHLQHLRSETRVIQRLLRGFSELENHRGCQPTVLGSALAEVLKAKTEKADAKRNQNVLTKTQYCRHYLRGHCKLGDVCQFAHKESDLGHPRVLPCAPSCDTPAAEAKASSWLNPDAPAFQPEALTPVKRLPAQSIDETCPIDSSSDEEGSASLPDARTVRPPTPPVSRRTIGRTPDEHVETYADEEPEMMPAAASCTAAINAEEAAVPPDMGDGTVEVIVVCHVGEERHRKFIVPPTWNMEALWTAAVSHFAVQNEVSLLYLSRRSTGDSLEPDDTVTSLGLQSREVLDMDFYNYNAAIVACETNMQWREALGIIAAVQEAALVPNVSSYISAIRTCEKSKQWQETIALLDAMQEAKLVPDIISCNAAIRACEQGQQWRKALDVLAAMRKVGITPDTISYNSAVRACEKGKQWQEILTLLQDMQETKLVPDGRKLAKSSSFAG